MPYFPFHIAVASLGSLRTWYISVLFSVCMTEFAGKYPLSDMYYYPGDAFYMS